MARTTAKKRWFEITAPKLFREGIVGDTQALESKLLVGKTMKVNLSTLNNDMRSQNTEVTLLIDHIEGDKAKTKLIGLRTLPNSIKRIVRKGRTRMDLSIKAITKDDKVATIKILLVSRRIIKGSVSSALIVETKRFLIKRISSLDFEALFELVVFGKLYKELIQRLGKIYPLKICEIRQLKLERFLKAMDLRKVKEDVSREKRMNTEEKGDKEAGEEKKEKEVTESKEEKKEEIAEESREENKEEKKEEKGEIAEEPKEGKKEASE